MLTETYTTSSIFIHDLQAGLSSIEGQIYGEPAQRNLKIEGCIFFLPCGQTKKTLEYLLKIRREVERLIADVVAEDFKETEHSSFNIIEIDKEDEDEYFS